MHTSFRCCRAPFVVLACLVGWLSTARAGEGMEETALFPVSEEYNISLDAQAGLCVAVVSNPEEPGVALEINGRQVDTGDALVRAQPDIQPRGAWVAYWKLSAEGWRLVLRSLEGKVAQSDAIAALSGLDPPFHPDLNARFMFGAAIIGGLAGYFMATDEMVENFVVGTSDKWKRAADRGIALGEGRAWYVVGERGEDSEAGEATFANRKLRALGDAPERALESSDPWAPDLQATGDGQGLDCVYSRGGRRYLWHDGPPGKEYGPADSFELPVYSRDGQHWAALATVEGADVLYMDGQATGRGLPASDEAADGSPPVLHACLAGGRLALISKYYAEQKRSVICLWEAGSSREVVTCPGGVIEATASEDGSRVLVSVWDEEQDAPALWDGTGWKHYRQLNQVAVTPNGRHWVADCEGRLVVDGEPTKFQFGDYAPRDLRVISDKLARVLTVRGGWCYQINVALP